ncbi:APH domain-containing protein [Fusarium sp. LHS14.1]|nr:APH domain-containing protein [Fusarium sp. LHS14.1]
MVENLVIVKRGLLFITDSQIVSSHVPFVTAISNPSLAGDNSVNMLHARARQLCELLYKIPGKITRPAAYWKSYDDLELDSDRYLSIERVLSSANFDYLKARAIQSRRQHQPDLPAHVECSVDLVRFTSGDYNFVLELAFSDNVYWIARIEHRSVGDHKTAMLSEIATMKIVREHTTIPVPRIFCFEASANQHFGYPYILMEYLGGCGPLGNLALITPAQCRAKVAKQVANVLSQLQNLTFSRIGPLWCGENADQPVQVRGMDWHPLSGPLETSFEYFYNRTQSKNREIMAKHPNHPDWLTACWVRKTALTRMIVEDRVRGPFPLCHLDLHPGVIHFDSEYNLTAIVDWSRAQAAPFEQSLCRELVPYPNASADIADRPVARMKELVVEFLKEMERNQERRPPLDDPHRDMTLDQNLMPLSTYIESKGAEITHFQQSVQLRKGREAGVAIATLMYGDTVTWEQLREEYGKMPLY